MMKLVTVQEMKQLEAAANDAGHSYAAMMENAGRAVAEAIQQRVATKGKRVLVLVGPGNNGGDGLVAARYLSQAGAQVACYMWKPRAEDDPNLKAVLQHNIHCLQANRDGNGKTLRKALQNADVIVDALLGTGVTRPIEGSLLELLDLVREVIRERRSTPAPCLVPLVPYLPAKPSIEASSPYVVAVDVPSGLDSDTGQVDPAAVHADMTVTFVAVKRGQLVFPGAQATGELVVADIGIDTTLSAGIETEVATSDLVSKLLPERAPNAHKGTFGRVLIVAGSINYTGAPYLAAAAAGRVGTGLVTLAPPQPLHTVLATRMSEATFLLLPHSTGVLAPSAIKLLGEHIKGYSALLLGPGLGHEKETVTFVHQLLGIAGVSAGRQIGFQREPSTTSEQIELPPLVIDADGLNALAEAEQWWSHLPAHTILTPHPGEMARLSGLNIQEIEQDRLAAARDHAARWGQIVVLKGAFTVVAAPDNRLTVIPFANPALSTAGTGDVLAGSIAGMLAQGLSPFDAAVCGAYLHGLAGEIVADQVGNAGALAGDLLPALPQALCALRAQQGKRGHPISQ